MANTESESVVVVFEARATCLNSQNDKNTPTGVLNIKRYNYYYAIILYLHYFYHLFMFQFTET